MKKALVGHEMGCGKTAISIFVGMSIEGPKLVVCPESLRLNWVREIERLHAGADISLVYSKDKSVKFGKDWTVMGYQTAVKFTAALLDSGIKTMFVDEAHNLKAVNNMGKPDSKRAENLILLSGKMDYLYLLTGTPMPSRNKDLYNELCMLGALNRDLPYAFHKFGVKYCAGVNNGFGWDYTGSSCTEELHDMLSDYMVHRLKRDVLPDLKKQRQFIPILQHNREYKEIEKRLYDMQDGDTYMSLAMTSLHAE